MIPMIDYNSGATINITNSSGTWSLAGAGICTSSTTTATNGYNYYVPIRQTLTMEVTDWNRDALLDSNPKITAGKKEIELPDGARLIVDDLGNYRIEDKDAKVTYQANRKREFSPYLNASDMLAKFVEYLGTLGIKKSEVMTIPIGLFITWLVIEAAERDKDPIPQDVVPIPKAIEFRRLVKPKCLFCQRYIPRAYEQKRFSFCNPMHAQRFGHKLQLALPGLKP